MNGLRKLILITIFILLITSISVFVVKATEPEDSDIDPTGLNLTSAAAIIIDFDTGLVVYEFNSNEMRVPASMVKMVAVYVIMDEIKSGTVNMDTVINITERTAAFSFNRAFSNVPLLTDKAYTVKDLLEVVIVRSASAATIALGDGIFGSEEKLVTKMNEKAIELGIPAFFKDSWGGSPDNRISARGMADLTRALLKEHPEVLFFTSMIEVVFDEIPYRSTNLLLFEYNGVDGLKTGFTNPAGWCFTGTANLGNRRIITVTMGSELGYRFSDSAVLLDHGFANINKVIADKFRSTLQPEDIFEITGSVLIPITMLNIYESQYLTMRDIALILNET